MAVPIASVGVAAAMATVAYGIIHPRAQVFGRIRYRAPSTYSGRGVALTFDDGPTPGGTDHVLDVLGELKVKVAFFVIGKSVQAHPHLVRRMHAEGHLVANHTFDHSHTACWGRARFWRWEIGRTDDAIAEVIGERPALFRPPMGLKSIHTIGEARRHEHTVATWSLRGLDTKPGATADSILQRLAPPARAGDVLLLHDGIEPSAPRRDLSPTVGAVAPLVRALREKGLEPVRLDELLDVQPYHADTGDRPFLNAQAPSKWA